MKRSEIERDLLELIERMESEGEPGDGTFIVDPALVYERVRHERPDIIRHMERHFHGNSYARVKGYMVTRAMRDRMRAR